MSLEPIKDALARGLGPLLPPRAVASILATLPQQAAAPVGTLDLVSTQQLVKQLATGVKLFGGASSPEVLQVLRRSVTGGRPALPRREVLPMRSDADVLRVQGRSQALCKDFFGATDCVRLATAASELARNIYLYAREGELTLELAEDTRGVRFSLTAIDHGPGIPDLERVLSGHYVSRTGLGRGLVGTRALLDHLEIETTAGVGTTVRGWKRGRWS
jgi:serine/threonine-protein kinase RsbT